MSEVKLTRRYPNSRPEDITDAFTRGYETGMAAKRGECHVDGGECDQCGAWVRSDAVTYWMPTGKGMQTEETHALRFCPVCGAKVVDDD